MKRTILPGSTFWNDWAKYPFSITNWNHRPLGVQIWALAYRTGEAWNEFGWSNSDFDAILSEALATADTEKRKGLMAKGEKLIQTKALQFSLTGVRFITIRVRVLRGGHHIS